MEIINKASLSKRVRIALCFIVMCIFIPSYNYYINEIVQIDLGMPSLSPLFYFLLIIIGLYSFTYLPRVNSKLLLLIVAVLSGLLISYVLYPGIGRYILSQDFNPLTSVLLFLSLMGFPLMIYTNYLSKHLYTLIDLARYPSLLLIVIAIIDYYWTVLINGNYFSVNYMSFSYYMLPAVCLSFIYGIRYRKILDISIAAMGLIVILIVGSRGCFVCGLIFLVIISIKKYTQSIGRFIIFLIALLFVILVIFLVFDSFSENVSTYMDNHGATSRTLLLMEKGTVGESDTREAIYKWMLDAVEEQPWGFGLMGDRYIVSQHGTQGYAHSLFYEFLVDYGLFFGPLLLLLLSAKLFFKFKSDFQKDDYYVLAAFLTLGYIKLFFSGSYLGEPFFWGLIGIVINNKNSNDF